MDSNSTTNPISIRQQEEVNLLNDLAKIFGKFFEWLFVIVALKNSNMGKSLFTTHHTVMMALVLMIVVYFLTSVLVTILQLYIRNFLPILIILMLGSVASVLALSIISVTIAWIALALWLSVFTFVTYYNHQEHCKLVLTAISEKIKNLIESIKLQCTRLPL